MATVRWINTSSNFWDVSNNWEKSPPEPPIAEEPKPEDNVTISLQFSDFTVTHRQGNTSVTSLTLAETLLLSGGTLTVGSLNIGDGGNLTVNTSLTANNYTHGGNGILSGTGTVTITGVANWISSDIRGSGNVNIEGSLSLGGNGSPTRILSGRTLNVGDTTWSGNTGADSSSNGAITLTSDAAINNTGIWRDQNGFSSSIGIFSGGINNRFNNSGTYRKSGNSTTRFDTVFSNTGTVEVQQGILELNGGGNSTGNFSVSNSGTLEFDNHILTNSSSITGAGKVLFDSGTTNLSGIYTLTGTTEVKGTVSLPGIATTGSYTQSGALNVEIGGKTAGSFDQLNVTGAATLGGSLNIS